MDNWTGELIGKMHNNGISSLQLAQKMNMNPKYVSQVLNCKVRPKTAENRFNSALNEIISELEGN